MHLLASDVSLTVITNAGFGKPTYVSKYGMTEIPSNFLSIIEFLPDGSATNDHKEWLKAWGQYAHKQVLSGKLKLYDIEGFNDETGEVPNAFIKDLYLKNRCLH